MRLYKAVDRNGAFFSGCDRVDREFRPGVYITAGKNIRFRGLVGERIRVDSVSASTLDFGAV